MKKYVVKNISGGPLVCTLADKKTTLRIKNNAKATVQENQMTNYLWNIEKKNLVTISEAVSVPAAKKSQPVSTANKEETKK